MKFEKRFQIEVVPEWRIKYIDYKGLKKKLRQVRREKLARDKEFVQNNHDLSVNSSRPHSARLEGTEISSLFNDKRTSIHSQQRTFTMNSVADSVQDFFHKVSSALVTLQRNPSVTNRNIPPPQQITSLDTLMDQVDPKERLFFTALDAELDKIEHFYKFKEIEATNRMNMLIQQYEILKEKKDEKDEKDEKKQSFEVWNTPRALVKQSIDYFTSPNLKGSVSTISLNTPEERQRYYKAAKKNIKKAVFEFYRGTELLKKYKTLNYNGFSKILKKYDKISERNGCEIYMQKVSNSYFVKSKIMKKLIKDAEDFYVTHFEGGSRSRALRNLRMPNKENKTYYHSILRVGLYLGLALPPLIHSLEKIYERVNGDNKNIWIILAEIYSGFLLPLIFLLLLGVSMYIWTKLHINYKFIFEFDSRSNLDFRQYLELPTIIFLVVSYIMLFNLQDEIVYIDSYTYPIILAIFIIAILFNPFRVLYYDARRWFIFSVARLFGSGILRVEFRDFFIADILTSLSYSLTTLRFFGYLNKDIGIEECDTLMVPGLSSLPAFLRFLQSYKRYRDTHQVNHLINLGKYGSIILAIWMSYGYRKVLSNKGEDSYTMLALWIIIQAIASIYSFGWDVKMDWSLFELHSMNYLLRDELAFEHHWLYYFAIISNFILRMSWLLLFTSKNPIIPFVLAFSEMLRRFQWSLFRVENEHINNCGQFRAIKEIPLPFQVEIARFDNADIINTDYDRTPSLASWSSWSKRLFSKRKLNPADSWKDFEPTKNTSEYMYPDGIYEESDDDSYDSFDEDDDKRNNARNTIYLTRMEGGHGLSNTYASRSFLPTNRNSQPL